MSDHDEDDDESPGYKSVMKHHRRIDLLANKLVGAMSGFLIENPRTGLEHVGAAIIQAVAMIAHTARARIPHPQDKEDPAIAGLPAANHWLATLGETMLDASKSLKFDDADEVDGIEDAVMELGFAHVGYSPGQAVKAVQRAREKQRVAQQLFSSIGSDEIHAILDAAPENIKAVLKEMGFTKLSPEDLIKLLKGERVVPQPTPEPGEENTGAPFPGAEIAKEQQ